MNQSEWRMEALIPGGLAERECVWETSHRGELYLCSEKKQSVCVCVCVCVLCCVVWTCRESIAPWINIQWVLFPRGDKSTGGNISPDVYGLRFQKDNGGCIRFSATVSTLIAPIIICCKGTFVSQLVSRFVKQLILHLEYCFFHTQDHKLFISTFFFFYYLDQKPFFSSHREGTEALLIDLSLAFVLTRFKKRNRMFVLFVIIIVKWL